MIEDFLALVDRSIYQRSGSVFYSGRSAFSKPNDLYILGLNPGGSPDEQSKETIEKNIHEALHGRLDWSAYQDESWRGNCPGAYGMQPRVLHLLRSLGRNPRNVPASNVVFVRTSREADLKAEKPDLLAACWPVHDAVIQKLHIKTILCFGQTAGGWVREKVGADALAEKFEEDNKRKWISSAHLNKDGLCVITLTHPSIAKWDTPKTDPTSLVKQMLER